MIFRRPRCNIYIFRQNENHGESAHGIGDSKRLSKRPDYFFLAGMAYGKFNADFFFSIIPSISRVAALAPKRTSSESRAPRHDLATDTKPIASRRFVLPLPLAPTNKLRLSEKLSISACSKFLKFLSLRPVITIEVAFSVEQTQRHNQKEITLVIFLLG